jgi:hypothetical protein
MEEKPKPRSVPLLLVGLLFGLGSGFVGAVYGISFTHPRGAMGLSERIVLPAIVMGPLVGAGVAVALWVLLPRRTSRAVEWILQLAADLVGAGLLAGVVCCLFAAITRG